MKLRLIKKEIINGKAVLTVAHKFLFWEYVVKYQEEGQLCAGYWSWLKLPGNNLVNSDLSFELDVLMGLDGRVSGDG